MTISRVLLIRHAHSEKNAADRHGGEGSELTEQGKIELDKLQAYLQDRLCLKTPTIFYSPVAQAELTAQYLSSSFSTPCSCDERIRSLNLGVLSGLSREEAAARYPEAAKRLQQWRDGTLTIEDLDIPHSELFVDFWKRGFSFLEEMLVRRSFHGDFVVVGTRSILILMANILLKETQLTGKRYTVFEFDNCGITLLRYIGQLKAEMIYHNETGFLLSQT